VTRPHWPASMTGLTSQFIMFVMCHARSSCRCGNGVCRHHRLIGGGVAVAVSAVARCQGAGRGRYRWRVASAEFNASKAGIKTLRAGGNAIDAAVAVASTLGVTEPFVAGPGGGGFMAIYLAKTHQVVTIDGREMCAAACTPHRPRDR